MCGSHCGPLFSYCLREASTRIATNIRMAATEKNGERSGEARLYFGSRTLSNSRDAKEEPGSVRAEVATLWLLSGEATPEQ